VLSFCVAVAIFTAYLLLSCCRVAVNAFGANAAALHGGVHDAETSLQVVFIERAYVRKIYA
jgi:hypothetical protein